LKINNSNKVGGIKFFVILAALYLAINIAIQAALILFSDIQFTDNNVSLFSWISAGLSVSILVLHTSKWNIKYALSLSHIKSCSIKLYLLAFTTAIAYVFFSAFIFGISPNEITSINYGLDAFLDNLPYILILTVIVPIYEEVIFRGILFDYANNKLNPITSSILLSILFSAIHPQHYGYMAISAFTFSLILYVFRWKLNSISPGILIHITYNFVSLIIFGRAS
jgi:membrane protease YdiL (CAAX protease family)